MEMLPIIALIISGMVALSQLSKEWRERRALRAKEKLTKDEGSMLPIRGANEAVIALQHALKTANENEDRLRARIVRLEDQNEQQDALIQTLRERILESERMVDHNEPRM
jgi:predicted  nucleic acid-binding Zn-ribbon protein